MKPRRLYKAPRLNLEYPGLAWLKSLRSAGSRVAAQALLGGEKRRMVSHRLIGAHRLHVTEFELELPGLPMEFDGLRVAHLTDIHHGPWMPLDLVRDVVRITNTLEPDLVVLTGDYVVNSPRYIEPVAAELAQLTPRYGTVGVLGNHDWWEGGALVQSALENVGIQMIDNSRCFLTRDGRIVRDGEITPDGAGCALCLTGVGDCWTDCVDLEKAMNGLPDDLPRLMLAHNPEVAEDPRLTTSHYRIDLMLSGHTHGGQVRPHLLGKNAVKPRRLLRHAHGLIQGPVCRVYISRGIGTAGVPLRFNMPPEIATFRFRSV